MVKCFLYLQEEGETIIIITGFFDVLPRLFILKNKIDIETIDYFLLPNIDLKFQKESLDLLEIPENKRISSQKFRHLSADEILSVDHPYVFLNDPTKDADNII